MRFFVAAVAALAALGSVEANRHHSQHSTSPFSQKELEQQFTSFIKKYNKQYTHEEFFHRFHTFQTNVEQIHQHNQSGKSWNMAVNEFSDLTAAEFKGRLGFKHVDHSVYRNQNAAHFSKNIKNHRLSAAASVDWRNSNLVTPVKDQGQCGSCWSFSTTGSVEGAVAQKTGKLTSLSEQQLVDCSTAQGNQGCNGGLMDNAFQYIISNKGLGSEESYPYTATGPNTCQSVPSVSTISSFQDVPTDEASLLKAVAQQPVSVAIEADQSAFQSYSGGVMDGTCGTNLDHGVLVVGYGTDSGKDYWIVKNSWGASWGEQGYIRIARGKNLCGISNAASFPIA